MLGEIRHADRDRFDVIPQVAKMLRIKARDMACDAERRRQPGRADARYGDPAAPRQRLDLIVPELSRGTETSIGGRDGMAGECWDNPLRRRHETAHAGLGHRGVLAL